jgi:hypothetical protein
MDEFIYYNPSSDDSQKVIDLSHQGTRILCYKCKSELQVVSNWEAAKKFQKRPGIYCPVSEKHVCVWFHLADERERVWERFNQLQEEKKKYEKL